MGGSRGVDRVASHPGAFPRGVDRVASHPAYIIRKIIQSIISILQKIMKAM